MANDNIVVRPFRADEWEIFKAIRLKALQSDPGVFGSNYAREAEYDAARWQSSLADPSKCFFGIFDGSRLIGLTGIYIKPEEPATAALIASWIEKNRRGAGVSVPMYKARIDWAKQQPALKRITYGCRASNLASGKAGQKHGFVFTHAEDHLWPDGQNEPHHFYELRL